MLEVIDTAIVNAVKAYNLLPLFENLKDLSGASGQLPASSMLARVLLLHYWLIFMLGGVV